MFGTDYILCKRNSLDVFHSRNGTMCGQLPNRMSNFIPTNKEHKSDWLNWYFGMIATN